jgi:hypothetical protein
MHSEEFTLAGIVELEVGYWIIHLESVGWFD